MSSDLTLFVSIIIISLYLPFPVSLAALDYIGPFQSLREGTTLVSKQGTFELGFFSPGNTSNRYVGIWYKKIPVQTVVWVANRCQPISDSSEGLLMINSSSGSLVLLGNNKSVVWSTSSPEQAQRPIVELLDSGNLVLRDEEDDTNYYLWQSFDYPTDTILPGMKFGWDLKKGLKRRFVAWRNWDDPCSGDLSFGLEFDPQLRTVPEYFMRKDGVKFYGNGMWNGIRFSSTPEVNPDPLYSRGFVYNDDEVYFIYNVKNNNPDIMRVVMNQTTSSRNRFIWSEASKIWKNYPPIPRDYCDKYAVCGANGNCHVGENPICRCLKGFKPKSQEKWESADWSEGCVRNTLLSCQEGKERDGFAKVARLKTPDSTHSWFNNSMNLRECKAKCLSECNCTAYTSLNISGKGSGCVIWFGDLLDVRQFSSAGQDLYVRMPKSELGRGVSAARVVIIGASVGGASLVLLFLVAFCLYRRRGFNGETDREEDLELPLFNLSIICTATDNFSLKNKLGEGGFGPVYKGRLKDGQEIAVKRLSISSGQGVNELKNEVKLIAKLQHRNLVKLLGCCIQGEEKLLVYEYMPNKSLDYFIFDQLQEPLGWSNRYKIICGITRGLTYLHRDSRLRVIHRDLKASNVLLDNEMNPKISDFGLARAFGGDQTEEKTSRVMGTYGYMAPEYAFGGLFSMKSDVFSFGILVLEIISGKKSGGFHHESHGETLIGHAFKLHKEGRSLQFIDELLRSNVSEHDLQEVLRCIRIGLLCVQQSPSDRPNMSSVVMMFGSEIELPEPRPPGYFTDSDSLYQDHHLSKKPESGSSTNEMTMSQLDGR